MTTSKQVSPTSVLAVGIKFSKDDIHVNLSDGREISVPIERFPRLQNATPEQRNKWRFIAHGIGIHWEEIDEDIAVETLLRLKKISSWPTANYDIEAKRQGAPLKPRGFVRNKPLSKIITVYRSSDTGKFVSSTFAKKHPKTTFKQTVRPPISKKKK
jgi:hypothetical protein